MVKQLSHHHNITAYFTSENELLLRQINNPVVLSDVAHKNLYRIIGEKKTVNIAPQDIQKLLDGVINSTEIVDCVTTFIFISSRGLVDDSEWTSYHPSEGISVLAEWLARNEPSAAPLFIDPNLVSKNDLTSIIRDFSSLTNNVVLGFSMIPANIENDIRLIMEIRQAVPDSMVVIGGIGSSALNLLPTSDGRTGIQYALPIDVVLENSGLKELAEISKSFTKKDLNPNGLEPSFEEISKSRITSRKFFIPYETPDIIHKTPYNQANCNTHDTTIQVLVDNRCVQNCYFCSAPKQQIFLNVEMALDYIEEKSHGAKIIAFNDNDLSSNITQTINLCKGMVDRQIKQAKHGKFSAREFSPILIDALAEANFNRIAVGVESFDWNVRSSLNKKNFTNENINLILNYLLEKGITPEVNLIIASPEETTHSLKKTILQALEWADKGCMLFTTIGLIAVPNSPSVMSLLRQNNPDDLEKIEFKEYYQKGMFTPILLPKYWKTSEGIRNLRDGLLNARGDIYKELHGYYGVEMPVPVKSYINIALLASFLHMEGFESQSALMQKIYKYAEKKYKILYVNI